MSEGVVTLPTAQTIRDETETTALACIVAPDRLEEAVAGIPPDRLLYALWWAEEILRRGNALRRALLIESQVAIQQDGISPEVTIAGCRFVFREDSKNDLQDIGDLMDTLSRLGASVRDLGSAVGYLRATDLQRIIRELPEDNRTDAYAAVDEHRVRRPTGWALVNTDSPYRSRRTKEK